MNKILRHKREEQGERWKKTSLKIKKKGKLYWTDQVAS